MTRKAIPQKLKNKLMYDCAYTCCICQQRGGHIHHIDEDHSNSTEDNLIVVCPNHHDDAHSKHDNSQNLSPTALLDAKRRWLDEVKTRRTLAATEKGQLAMAGNSTFASMGISWGYINHRRVSDLARVELLDGKDKQYFEYCVARGIIDAKGILLKPSRSAPPSTSYIGNTIYDWFEHGDDHRLHVVYRALVDQISKAHQPIHLKKESWTKTRIKDLVQPGKLLFVESGFYFKAVKETEDNEHRKVSTFKRKVHIEFFVDTRDMFGTTSISVSFTGHKHASALVLLKSLEETTDRLVLHCTPLALGVGFGQNWQMPVIAK